MPIEKLNAERCAQRRRIAARRDGVEASPVRFLREPPPPPEVGELLLSVEGALPESHEAEMAAINALIPTSEQPLSAHNVFIHYFEAANDNFVGDRYCFLDASTLKNIAADAAAGIAFMNSHRDGGLSQPSELPFGKTFAGRYEAYVDEAGVQRQRSLVGFYMLRGVLPNGSAGPTTDDLDRMIRGGTVADVSVGLRGGERICDVCGNEVGAYDRHAQEYLCSHMPGSDRKMDDDQKAAQLARGVPKGKASYSLVDARMGEVSAVYDGAVPGAGFRKALGLARMGALSARELGEARHVYGAFLGKEDFAEMAERAEVHPPKATTTRPAPPARKDKKMNLIERFRAFLGQLEEEGDADLFETLRTEQAEKEAPPPKTEKAPAVPPAIAAQMKAMQERLDAQEARHAEETKRRIEAEAENFADGLIREGKLIPVEKPALLAAFIQACHDDDGLPAKVTFGYGKDQKPLEGGRVDALRALFAARPAHVLFGQMPASQIPEGAQFLVSRGEPKPPDEATRAEADRLLAETDSGRRVLAHRVKNRNGD